MDKIKDNIKFPFKCPVCGKSEFEDVDYLLEEDKDVEVYTIDPSTGEKRLLDAIEAAEVHCEFCGWTYDLKQVLNYDVVGNRNDKTVNEQKKEYQNKIQENPDYSFDKEMAKPKPHICPICGEFEFANIDSYDVCPVCGWIDDGIDTSPFTDYSEVNVISIKDAKEEFKKKRLNDAAYKWKKRK